jgi:glycopeptide antibiotics resistance protein
MIPRDTALVVFFALVVVFVPAWALLRRPPLPRLILVTASLVYGALVMVATFFPLPIQASLIEYERSVPQASSGPSLVPFAGIVPLLGTTPETALRQLAGNVLLFVPFGFMAPLLAGTRSSAVRTLVLALAASAAIEGMQFVMSAVLGFPYRIASLDDIILNLLGACGGYLAYVAARPLLEPALRPPTTGSAEVQERSLI